MSLRIVRNQGGFTLAEMLVATAMIGLVMSGLFSLLRTGQQSYLTGSNQVEAQQGLRLAMLRLSNEIREAGYCPTCTNLASPLGAFPAIMDVSATGFTIQNDWSGDWDGTTGMPTNGTVNVPNADGTTTPRGERIIYAVTGNALTRQEVGVNGTAVTVLPNLGSLTFTYLDAAGNVTATPANIRTVVVNVVGQPEVQPTSFMGGKVQVAMTDTIRLRNRAQ
jgi:type IV pilus assembly protein PilW